MGIMAGFKLFEVDQVGVALFFSRAHLAKDRDETKAKKMDEEKERG